MTTETVTVQTLDIVDAEIGLVVMDAIMLDTLVKTGDIIAIEAQKKVFEDGMKKLDCVQLSEAMYHYEKATGKLGQSTYLR